MIRYVKGGLVHYSDRKFLDLAGSGGSESGCDECPVHTEIPEVERRDESYIGWVAGAWAGLQRYRRAKRDE